MPQPTPLLDQIAARLQLWHLVFGVIVVVFSLVMGISFLSQSSLLANPLMAGALGSARPALQRFAALNLAYTGPGLLVGLLFVASARLIQRGHPQGHRTGLLAAWATIALSIAYTIHVIALSRELSPLFLLGLDMDLGVATTYALVAAGTLPATMLVIAYPILALWVSRRAARSSFSARQ